MNDKQLIEAIANSEQLIEFATTPGRAFILIAQLQLALRHPHNTGSSAELVREIAENLTKAIAAHIPGAEQLIERGWHAENDVSRDEFSQYWDELEEPS